MHDNNWKGGKCIREISKHLEKQEYQPRGQNQALWVTCHLNPAVWCRIMATICHTNEKIEAAHHQFQRRLLGITWRDKVRNEDIGKKTGPKKLEDIIKKEDSDGWDTSWELTTLKQLVRQQSGNWEVTRESQDDQGRTGQMSSNETSDRWTWPGKKPRNWRTTKWNGVDVWPNAAICMRDEQTKV